MTDQSVAGAQSYAPSPSGKLPFLLSAADVLAFGYRRSVTAIEAALRGGLDPADDPARTSIPVGDAGTLLSMPSYDERAVGIKIVTHNPGNPSVGRPLVHGIYVHFDRATLVPVALLDGAALTTLRTPAVSVAAIRPALARFADPIQLVVFGAGPQAVGHAEALYQAAHDVTSAAGIGAITYVLRHSLERPLPQQEPGIDVNAVQAGSPAMDDMLRRADIVVCATGSRQPLFDSGLLGHNTVVIAVGGHDPDAAEVDTAFAGRATVIVEDRATARRECGEIVQAVAAGALDADDLLGIADAVSGRAADRLAAGPVLFKGSGMAWEDLVVADAIISDMQQPKTDQVEP